MSRITKNLKRIEDLDANQLADALEMNGYASCVGVIRTKHIDGETLLKLTELQLSLWRLPNSEARRLWSFMQQVKRDPTQFLMKSQISDKTAAKVTMLNKPPINDSGLYSNLPNNSNFSSNPPPNVYPKPNRFSKPAQIRETKEANSSTLTKQESKLSKGKVEPLQKAGQTSERQEANSSTLTKQEGTLMFKDKIEQLKKTGETSERQEANSSTLTKLESKSLKSKLELVLKKESNESANSSFIYNQKQPILPPKPDHLKLTALPHGDYEESPDDYNDGYLAPIHVDPNQPKSEPQMPENERRSSTTMSRNASNRSSFLNRLRKNNYDNLEMRPEVIENKYEEQTTKHKAVVQSRPLPPVPMVPPNKNNGSVMTLDTDDEELAEYASVPDNQEPEIRKGKKGQFHRPLPPVPIEQVRKIKLLSEAQQNKHQWDDAEDDEELAEYTPVIEDDEITNKGMLSHRIIKLPRSPLPPPHISASLTLRSGREITKLATPNADKNQLPPIIQQTPLLRPRANEGTFKSASATLPKSSSTLPNSRAELPFSATLPKAKLPTPPTNLPKPPVSLPNSSFLTNSQNEQPCINFCEIPEDKRLPPPLVLRTESAPVGAHTMEDEHSFYTEIDLARESSYRETDRKGARRLLTGLQDGAFVIRPSRQSQYICTLSIMHSTKMFNLGIERNPEGALTFGSVTMDFDQPQFYNIAEVLTYYSLHPLYLSGESIYLKDVLPRNKY